MLLEPHQLGYTMLPRKSIGQMFAMLPDSRHQIASYSDVKRAIPSTRQNVGGRLLVHKQTPSHWVPACAGMTIHYRLQKTMHGA
jgi:hypothetical protein